MRIRYSILIWQLFLFPNFANAETIEVACIHREYRMTLSFKVDTLQNRIIHNGVIARDVYIDKTTISFFVDLTSGEYFHFISRPSGNMTVKAPHGTLIYGYECGGVNAKF
jgi:hypothetical protein